MALSINEHIGTISIDLDFGSFRRDLDIFVTEVREAVRHALFVVARELWKDSKLYVPVLTGRLRDSGRVKESPYSISDSIEVRVIYGNEVVTWAIKQHEVPYNHPSLGFFGPAKYLDKPLQQNYGFYLSLFNTEVQIALARRYFHAAD